jgi:hypothetical protein
MIGNDFKNMKVLRRRQVTLERLATWIGFAGAVVLQGAVLLLCYRAVSDAFEIASVALPAAIAVCGGVMLGGGRLAARRNRSAVARRPQLALLGGNRSEPITETHRSAA